MAPAPRLISHSFSPSWCVSLALILALFTPIVAAQSSSVFNGPRDYPVGSSPASVVIGDFNGDGRPDIATANSVSNDVSVLLQNSDGTFQTAMSYPVGHGPTSIQVGDVNGDGKLDLVLINSTDNTLAVLLGNGDGTFQAQQLTTFPANPQATMVVGDFNGDGKADVALGEPLPQVGNYAVAVLLSNGNGTFQAAVTYPVNADPVALGLGDFNNDGKLDIVSAAFGNGIGISVLLGNGDGTFQAAINSATSVALQAPPLLIEDFNQDGNLDIAAATVAADTGANVTLFLGNGDGTFQVSVISLPALNSSGTPLAAGDLNGDGAPDLVVSEGGSQNIVLLNDGHGAFNEGSSLTLNSRAVALSDLNLDHTLDLVAGVPVSQTLPSGPGIVSVLHGNGDGSFAQFPSYAVTTGTLGNLVAADFNSDGKTDLGVPFVVSNTGSSQLLNLGVLLNSGAGFLPPTVTLAQQLSVNTGTASVAAGDFNGDGKMDAAESYSGTNNGISVLLGKGDGTFQSAVQYGSSMVGPLAVGDFNNDGKLDIVGNSSTGVSVLLGNGDGTFGFPVTSSVGGPGALAVADFNRDGKLDVAVLGSTLTINLGNGDGTFSPGATYSNIGFSPQAIASGDLNGDGIADIVIGNYYGFDTVHQVSTPSSIVVLLGNGDGTFQSPVTTILGSGITAIAIADFNLDGKADVVIANSGWGDISLLLGNGDGTLQPPMEFFPGVSLVNSLTVADFDGNGTPDLAVAGATNISVLLNAAGSRSPAALLSAATLAFGSSNVGQTTSPQTVTLSYMASSALTITSIAISGTQSSDFVQSNTCGTSLPAGGNCTISVTFSPQAIGARIAAIQITDNASNSPQTISLTGTGTAPPTIGLGVPSGGSSSATVAAGQPASYTLSIGGTGMSGTATLTCTGAPQGVVCSVPATATVSATAASNIQVSVTTTSRAMAAANHRGLSPFGGALAAILTGIILVPTAWKKRDPKMSCLGALVIALMLISSCGGGSSSSTNPNGTPAGSYNMTVTATMNSATQSTTLTLIVQ
jgi:FG-GAP-like repeat/Abnormal spindle-like microcephaly-assoc'd, ASPM-SPD-2-Hydin/FG-GAP repeat